MVVGWAIALAVAAPLVVEVVPDAPPARGVRAPVSRPGPVPVGRGAVVVDGVLDEAAWRVEPTPLAAVALGAEPPDRALRVAVTERGVAWAAPNLTAGEEATLLLDPDGLGQAWIEIRVGEQAATLARCSLGERLRPTDFIPEHAVPCRAASGLSAVRGADGWEIAVEVPTLTARARVGWLHTVRGEVVGTWAPTGAARLAPTFGRSLALGPEPGRLTLATDVDGGWWSLSVNTKAALGPATWTRWHHGRVVDAGPVTLAAGETTWRIPDRDLPGSMVEVRVDDDAWPGASMVVGARRGPLRVTLGTPVYVDGIELAWWTPDPTTTPLRVYDAAGALLGEAVVELPAGTGTARVRAEPAWGRVRVVVGDLLRADAARAVGGTP